MVSKTSDFVETICTGGGAGGTIIKPGNDGPTSCMDPALLAA